MIEPRVPKFDWGQRVVVGMDLYNDGSYPDRGADELLVREGTQGEVVQVGLHTESQTPVYMIEFGEGLVVGCLEEEISLPDGLAAVPAPGTMVPTED